jgi:3',5'-cyclic AMP phosphodiesterase CpdA
VADTLSFAHLSDPHLSSLVGVAAGDLLSKRALGYLSWRRRRRAEHRPEVLAALRHDLEITRPDHIVISGDLTHLGLPSEFQETRQWLHSLGSPSHVTVVPGNHDAYVATPWHRTFALWAPYFISDGAQVAHASAQDVRDSFPSLRIRGPAAFIGICTAVPSAPLLAIGRLGHEQMRRLERMLGETGRQPRFRILLMHHPPVPGALSWRKRLTDGPTLRSVLARRGAELVLHGHTHRTTFARIETAAGPVPVIGVPSASLISNEPDRCARYHVYQLRRDGEEWALLISVRRYLRGEARFVGDGEPRLVLRRSLIHPALL